MKRLDTDGRAVFLMLTAGFGAWSVIFVGLYSLLSVGCALRWDAMPLGPWSLQRVVLVGAWLLSLLPIALMLALQYRLWTAAREGEGAVPMVVSAGAILTALALAATVWNFGMVTFLSTCR